MIEKLREDLRNDEDEILLPYEDSVGKITIGIGRNLTDRGISKEESAFLFENDLKIVFAELDSAFPWWRDAPENVQRFMANLNFNLGLPKFRKFTTTLKLIERRQYKSAAKAFRENKRYFSQVKGRAERLAILLETT